MNRVSFNTRPREIPNTKGPRVVIGADLKELGYGG